MGHELQGDYGTTQELWAPCPPPADAAGSGSCTCGEGEDFKSLFGNVSPACVRPFSSSRESLLTSRYPQGDAARMGAPGEKGPNGLPVSMDLSPLGAPPAWPAHRDPSWGEGASPCALFHKGPHLSQKKMHFSHHKARERCKDRVENIWSSTKY